MSKSFNVCESLLEDPCEFLHVVAAASGAIAVGEYAVSTVEVGEEN